MAQATWTKEEATTTEKTSTGRMKFFIGGGLMIVAIIFLVVNALQGTQQYYVTVDEYFADQSKFASQDLRVSGLVIGESIQFNQIDATTSRLEFDIVDDLQNPGQRLHIVAMNEPMPDLLQHEAQALVEGSAEGGTFTANPGGLFLKCPTRYEEVDAGQSG
jgi:cytochrome c-type biogenesis protein CcmE